MAWPKWVRWMLAFACLFLVVGCDATKPEKFAGFATEQLSEQIEIVSAKLNESIESNQQAQSEILSAVRDLSQTVAGMKLASQKEIEELKKVSGKVKTKLTSAGDEKKDVATLDPNAAPSATLEIDSLDEAAKIIEALTKRVEALEKRSAMSAAALQSTAMSSAGGNCTGNAKPFSGNSSGSSYQVYQSAPVVSYSAPVYSETVYSTPATPVYQSNEQCYTDPVTGQTVCNRSTSQTQQYRTGLFGRKIPVR